MTRDLNRLQAKLMRDAMGDGPLERQLILLKLSLALDTHPSFGDKYVSEFRAPQQKWIAEVSALLKRVGFNPGYECDAIRRTMIQHWKPSMDQLCQLVQRTIAELKLELELEGHEQIGQVYNAGEVFDLFADLKQIIGKAEKRIMIVDAYFSADAFSGYLTGLEPKMEIKILAGQYADDVKTAVDLHTAQFHSSVELRRSKDMHDRVIIIDDVSPWIIGASIKDAGKKPTYLFPVPPQLAAKKIKAYEEIWAGAAPLD